MCLFYKCYANHMLLKEKLVPIIILLDEQFSTNEIIIK